MMRATKDSGIAWIGDIPGCWEIDKLKYHLKRNEPKNPGEVVVLSLYRELGVIPKDNVTPSATQIRSIVGTPN